MGNLNFKAKCVVWDLDGTLLNSYHLQKSVLTEVLRRRNIPIPPRAMFAANYHGRLRDSIMGICGLEEGKLLDDIYEDFIKSEDHYYEDPVSLFFPDAIELLEKTHAQGIKQIIISNRSHHNDTRLGSPRNLVQRAPLRGYVDAVVCGDDNEFHKPDARMLDVPEEKLGLRRSNLLVVGDQFVDGVLAHNLRVKAILVSRNGIAIPHLERLEDGWKDKVTITDNLSTVVIQLK